MFLSRGFAEHLQSHLVRVSSGHFHNFWKTAELKTRLKLSQYAEVGNFRVETADPAAGTQGAVRGNLNVSQLAGKAAAA